LMNSTAAVNSATLGYNIGNGYSTAGSSFTAPESGKYQVIGMILVQSTNVLANEYELQLTKGASFGSSTRVVSLDRRTATTSTSFTLKGVTEVNLTKGDTIYLALLGAGDNSSNTLTISGTPDVTNFQISRLTDEYGNPVVGFGYVTQESAGLVKRAGQLLGTDTNDNAAAGYVGEYFVAQQTTDLDGTTSGGFVNITSLTLPPGDYDISATAVLVNNSTTFTNTALITLGTTPESNNSGSSTGIRSAYISPSTLTTTARSSNSINPTRITVSKVSGTVTYYLTAVAYFSAGSSPKWRGVIQARRVR
jgi:hypothetical protein